MPVGNPVLLPQARAQVPDKKQRVGFSIAPFTGGVPQGFAKL